jgi:hypothetical protein
MAILISQQEQEQAEELRRTAPDSINAKLAREMVLLYIEAEKAVLTSQSYQIAGQSLTRANLEQIRKGRQEWQETLNDLTGGGQRRFRSVIPAVNL